MRRSIVGLVLVATMTGVVGVSSTSAGTAMSRSPRATSSSLTGYWMLGSDGAVYTFGNLPFYGDLSNVTLNSAIIDIIGTASGDGYYLLGSDGGVFCFGNARFYGSIGGKHLNQPIEGIVPTTTGRGYWLVASDGGVFAFG